MVQNLTNEIILVLMHGPLHTRGIAESLRKSHATLIRRLQEMVEENSIDFRFEGKNKVYFLKKSLEGRNAVIIAEMYRQSQLIAAYPQVRGIIRAILDLQEVRLALIFGSYAKGTAHERSDIDLFIETENRTLKKSLEDQFSALSIKIGLFTTEHPLIREIVNDHIIVKGVEEYLEKTKLFA
ncbi:MAG TPA: nucleotidyltransferase domain-containing protein [Methanoregulaceae archaeon]|nr:nucleotidyltransferase domain-containing protein [Methanoregulaceae archaeon]HPA08777.1 nucleotidyltransferase domain-containing protein [Methanoregulaceae archaeon]HQN90117.1 nucleotidyltransferase domain-containing protein [Methanoregulaceae archaeon]HQP83126.1 nucleotidyltransferase domain-containing protein [Methanoregulaceae archaeon]